MQKDTFKVIHNPTNHVFKFEVWLKGIRKDMTATGYAYETNIVKRVSSWRTAEKATEVVKYYEDLQSFREDAVNVQS